MADHPHLQHAPGRARDGRRGVADQEDVRVDEEGGEDRDRHRDAQAEHDHRRRPVARRPLAALHPRRDQQRRDHRETDRRAGEHHPPERRDPVRIRALRRQRVLLRAAARDDQRNRRQCDEPPARQPIPRRFHAGQRCPRHLLRQTNRFTMLILALTFLAACLYAAAAVRVRRRRGTFSRVRALSFAAGLAVLLAGALMPDERFSLHMTQHLLIGDIAPLLVVLGLTGPLLRPVLAIRALRALRVLAHPLVALPLWAIDLCVWHLTPLFDAALRHESLHALQHLLFFTCGALLWSALLELLPGPRWFRLPQRLGYLGVMWLVSLTLSQVFLWSSHPYYYDSLNDQRAGGGIMLAEGSAVMLGVLVWLLWEALVRSEHRGAVPTHG